MLADLTLVVNGAAHDDREDLDQLTNQLRHELLELDVHAVRQAPGGEVPSGAKAVGVLAIGALVVEFARSSRVLTAVIGAVQSWLAGRPGRTVKVQLDGESIEVTGVSAADQRQLIDAWITRHAG